MFTNIYINTRTAGAYGSLVLAPAEGMGALRTPCQVFFFFFFFFFFFLLFLLLKFVTFF